MILMAMAFVSAALSAVSMNIFGFLFNTGLFIVWLGIASGQIIEKAKKEEERKIEWQKT